MGARRIAVVAGEASGDILGAGLIARLKEIWPDALFLGVGGPRMIAAGLQSRFDMERLSVMGITEVLGRLPELLRRRRDLVRWLMAEKVDIYIGIDSPDFNLPIARRLHRRGVRTVHYVSPSVWAWRQGRIAGIRKSIDLMLTLLPFEAAFYEQHGVPVRFVGHPLADQIPLESPRKAAREALGLPEDVPVLAVLPGSRGGEVREIWPRFRQAMDILARRRPGLRFVVPAAGEARYRELEPALGEAGDVILLRGGSHRAMAAADVVLLASGTATLEALLFKKPMVVGYRVSGFTYRILRRLLKTPWVSLPNLLARAPLVPELIQDAMTPAALAAAVEDWLDAPERRQALAERFMAFHRSLRRDASARAARAIAEIAG